MKKFRLFWVILLLAVLTTGFFWRVLAHPGHLMTSGRGDLVQLFAARKHFQVTGTLENGELTLWDPHSDCGAPVVGNIQNAIFYPLYILFYIMPTDSAFGFIFMAEMFLGGVFAYLFARSFKLSRGAGIAGAVVYMFSGIWTSKLYPGHIMVYNNFAWIMLGLFLVRTMMLRVKERRWSAAAFWALLLAVSQAVQFLGGHTQFWVYSTFLLGTYCLFEIVCGIVLTGNVRIVAGGGLFGIALGVCVLLVMVQAMPALEFAQQVLQEGRRTYAYQAGGGFSEDRWILFTLPNYYGSPEGHNYWGGDPYWEVCPYVGILPLILALAAPFVVSNRYTWYFAAAGLFALFFAMGDRSVIFRFFIQLPGFSAFRVPARMLTQMLPPAAVLTAFAWDGLFSKTAGKLRWRRAAPVIIAVVIALIMAMSFFANRSQEANVKAGWRAEIERRQAATQHHEHKTFYQEALDDIDHIFARVQRSTLIVVAICVAGSLLFLLGGIGGNLRTACGVFALILITADLAAFGMPFIHTLPVNDPLVYPEHTELLDYLAKDKSMFRTADFNSPLIYHRLRRRDYALLGGDLDSSRLTHYREYADGGYADIEKNDINNALNVKYFFSRIPFEDFQRVRYDASGRPLPSDETREEESIYKSVGVGDLYVAENPECFPRAFVVRKVKAFRSATPETIMTHLKQLGKNMKKEAAVEGSPDFPLENEGDFKAAEITDYRPNRITVQVELEHPGFLVLSEVWYPDWKAYDTCNGVKKEVRVWKTNLTMRGVYLEKGKHSVEFVYEPRAYYTGMIVTLITLPIVLILLVLTGLLARRPKTVT